MDQTVKAILDTLACLGGNHNGVIYVTVPITTGLREFQLMRDLSCDREQLRKTHRDRWVREVKEPNEADAQAFALMVQLQHEDRLVLNPAALQIDSWAQDQYTETWNKVLSQFCDRLVVTPDWAFSVGARLEVQQMLLIGRGVYDVFGREQTPVLIEEGINRAESRLLEMGWSTDEVANLLPPVKIPRASVRMNHFDNTGVYEAMKWLIRERVWQNRVAEFRDLERTRLDGPRAESGMWRQKLDKYLNLARDHGIETDQGGTNLLVFVSLAVAMMESVSVHHGAFPEPGVPSGEPIRVSTWAGPDMDDNQRLAVIFAWLLREQEHVRRKFGREDDDTNTRGGLHAASWWSRQLNLYWTRAHHEGLNSLRGRQMLGKFTSTALGLASSRIRLWGLPPSPARLSVEELRERGLFDVPQDPDE